MTILEAFTSASGTLKTSIEAATPNQRAFAIRAAIASKKIHEWLAELSAWPWPMKSSEGFEMPIAKRRKLSNRDRAGYPDRPGQEPRKNNQSVNKEEFWGSLPAQDVIRYELRIQEISEDMEDLNVEEIKSQVLDTHFSPKSRPSSSVGHYTELPSSQSYTKMDDLTAVVTATVLQALPSLSRLMALMSIWSVRLAILRQVTPLMSSMEDAEVALRSGWTAIQTRTPKPAVDARPSDASVLSRQDYEIIRDVLQQKVSALGQQLDHMLDALEGRDDTLPEAWLDRMESIERDYGEWVVSGEGKVREGEWTLEMSKRRQELLRNSVPAMIDPSPSDTHIGKSVPELQDDNMAVETHSTNSKHAHTAISEAATVRHTPPTEPTDFPLSIVESLPKYSELSQADRVKESNTSIHISNDAIPSGDQLRDPKRAEEVTWRDERDELDKLTELPLIESAPSPSSDLKNAVFDKLLGPGRMVTDLSTLSDGVSDNIVSSKENMKSSSLPQIPVEIRNEEQQATDKDEAENTVREITDSPLPIISRHVLTTTALPEDTETPSTPCKPATPPGYSNSNGVMPKTETPGNDYSQEVFGAPTSFKVPRFGHPLANSLRREMLPEVSYSPSNGTDVDSDRSDNVFGAQSTITTFDTDTSRRPQTSPNQPFQDRESQKETPDLAAALPSTVTELGKPVETTASKSKPPRLDLHLLPAASISEIRIPEHANSELNCPNSGKSHHRGPSSASIISGYATSEPSPVIYEAEPTEYFRPASPPIIYNAESPDLSDAVTPTRASFNKRQSISKPLETPIKPSRESDISSPDSMVERQPTSTDSMKEYSSTKTSTETISHERTSSDDSAGSVLRADSGHRRTSQASSVSPDISSTISERLYSANTTPVRMSSLENNTTPYSLSTGRHSSIYLKDYEEESPTVGHFKLQNDILNRSPASSSPLESPISDRRPLPLHKTPSFDPDSFYPESPKTPGHPPALSNVEVSPMPALPSPSKHSDDQLQQQISEILESIPARIRLASESDTTGTSGIRQIKRRISLNPFSRPSSRATSRAPTPSFTLAPAQPKNPRPRAQNSNPEIKLYHLSRSTGEAPIKLFVRLVGENGERVMVRVGGGWADLGEYLKEYASHHGRRSDQAGKVEIQDLPPRIVSTGSTSSMFTLRNGNGKTSEKSSPVSQPGSRPGSAFGRPLSSLAIRKTRKSVGEEARENSYRSPSTPLPHALRNSLSLARQSETPPSASTRSVSSMSWREEESSLGLAGPKSRKSGISAENAAWVESMKEKVRIASAEKEKKVKEKAGFGELGQVGATKRLFKKSG